MSGKLEPLKIKKVLILKKQSLLNSFLRSDWKVSEFGLLLIKKVGSSPGL